MNIITLQDLLSIFNTSVKYKVFNRFDQSEIELKPYRKDRETYKKTVYEVFQQEDGTLKIYLY